MKDKIINSLISEVGFDFDATQEIYYSKTNPWQKNFGYFALYDHASPLAAMFIHCEPVVFDYDGRKWKIEFWKGRYGIATGAEVGLYTGSFKSGVRIIDHTVKRFDDSPDTNCANEEDWLRMSFILKKGTKTIFTRDSNNQKTKETKHWWLTGFKAGVAYTADELTNEITIHFKDVKMADAFVGALTNKKGLNYAKEEFTQTNEVVNIIFGKPHSTQPNFDPLKIKVLQDAFINFFTTVYRNIKDYTIEDVVNHISKWYKFSEEEVFKILKKIKFSLEEIGNYFIKYYKKNVGELTRLLIAAEFRAKNVFKFLANELKIRKDKIFDILISHKYSLTDIQNYIDLNGVDFAKLLADKGYSLPQIGRFLGNDLNKSVAQTLIILSNLNFNKVDILAFLAKQFKLSAFDLGNLWIKKVGW